MKHLSQDAWSELLAQTPDAVVLDVRSALETEEGKIPNAINLDIYNPNEFMISLEKLNPEGQYFVYCQSGSRSQQACALMKHKGFKNLYNLEGGFALWEGKIEY